MPKPTTAKTFAEKPAAEKTTRARSAHVLVQRKDATVANLVVFGDAKKALKALGTTHRGWEYNELPFGEDLAASLEKLGN